MNFRTYRATDPSAPERWRALMQEAVCRWRDDWGIGPAADIACSLPQPDSGRPVERTWAVDGIPRLWLAAEEGLPAALERAMFAPDRFVAPADRHADSGFVLGIAHKACEDLIYTVVTILGLEHAELVEPDAPLKVPADLLCKGSGALEMSVSVAGKSLWFLAADLAARHRPLRALARPACRPLSHAAAGQPVHLRVEVGAANVPIGVLRTLGIGDVIRLEASLDDPMRVVVVEGSGACEAQLCTADGQRAIELTRSH
jgi:hypothetical protein